MSMYIYSIYIYIIPKIRNERDVSNGTVKERNERDVSFRMRTSEALFRRFSRDHHFEWSGEDTDGISAHGVLVQWKPPSSGKGASTPLNGSVQVIVPILPHQNSSAKTSQHWLVAWSPEKWLVIITPGWTVYSIQLSSVQNPSILPLYWLVENGIPCSWIASPIYEG